MEEEIKHLLAISDPDSTITDVITDDETMVNYIFIEKNESLMYCSVCGARMHSRGVRTRKVNHPALQTGYNLNSSVNYRV